MGPLLDLGVGDADTCSYPPEFAPSSRSAKAAPRLAWGVVKMLWLASSRSSCRLRARIGRIRLPCAPSWSALSLLLAHGGSALAAGGGRRRSPAASAPTLAAGCWRCWALAAGCRQRSRRLRDLVWWSCSRRRLRNGLESG